MANLSLNIQNVETIISNCQSGVRYKGNEWAAGILATELGGNSYTATSLDAGEMALYLTALLIRRLAQS